MSRFLIPVGCSNSQYYAGSARHSSGPNKRGGVFPRGVLVAHTPKEDVAGAERRFTADEPGDCTANDRTALTRANPGRLAQ